MSIDRLARGRVGEEAAAREYERAGYILAEKNYHSRYGEIDIILQNSEYIVFCEVKLRSGVRFGSAAQAVTNTKIKKLIKTAEIYLQKKPSELQPRFDVAEVWCAVTGGAAVVKDINIIENAFDLSTCARNCSFRGSDEVF